MIEELLRKSAFNIKDLSKIVKKETQTIRSWEAKGIIDRPARKTDDKHEWREYTREDLAQALENIVNYDWKRKVIKNKSEIEYIIDFLRNNKNVNDIKIMSIKNE